jgi:DNA-binding NarL/FixJ family response regulator
MNLKKIKVVLADDHTIFREGLTELLERSGNVEVIGEASNGIEAIDLILKKKPDIAIMDVSMPKMSGLNALSKVKDLMPEVKILILSMYNNQQYIDEAMANGASGYVMKDVAGSELLNAIELVLNNETYLSPTVTSQVMKKYLNLKAIREKGIDKKEKLTQREIEILKLLALGKTNREISSMLFISIKTVETHRKNIMNKLSLRNLADIVRYAIKNELINI